MKPKKTLNTHAGNLKSPAGTEGLSKSPPPDAQKRDNHLKPQALALGILEIPKRCPRPSRSFSSILFPKPHTPKSKAQSPKP